MALPVTDVVDLIQQGRNSGGTQLIFILIYFPQPPQFVVSCVAPPLCLLLLLFFFSSLPYFFLSLSLHSRAHLKLLLFISNFHLSSPFLHPLSLHPSPRCLLPPRPCVWIRRRRLQAGSGSTATGIVERMVLSEWELRFCE